jgi:hypothetical protein
MRKKWLIGAAAALPVLAMAGAISLGTGARAYGAKAGKETATVGVILPPKGQAPVLPADIPGGAPKATLLQAAAFAWQEFIALTWPAQPTGGAGGYNRDTPNAQAIYG